MKNILIVGGAGFVGSNLTQYILKHKQVDKIWIIDNLLSSDIQNIPVSDKVEFLHGSVVESLILSKLPKNLDSVFHLACYHGNQSSIYNPLADHQNNALTSLVLFDWLVRHCQSVKKVIYAAAGCAVAKKTYENAEATFEDDPISLYHDSPYSISKLIGEFYGNYYFKRHHLPFIKARFQNVYGPKEILGAGEWRGTVHTVWRNVVPTFIWKALRNEPLPIDNGGDATRDFIYVEDIVRGLIACQEKGKPGDTYNLASGKETSILELANLINQVTGNRAELDVMPRREWDNSGHRYGSTKKSELDIGFTAEVDLLTGLERTVSWTRENKDFISRSMGKHSRFLELHQK